MLHLHHKMRLLFKAVFPHLAEYFDHMMVSWQPIKFSVKISVRDKNAITALTKPRLGNTSLSRDPSLSLVQISKVAQPYT